MTSTPTPRGAVVHRVPLRQQKNQTNAAALPLQNWNNVSCLSGELNNVVHALKPSLPLYVTRPDVLMGDVKTFLNAFPGDAVYAVKCNPDKTVLNLMHKAGVKSFDVASLDEIRAVKKVAPKAKLYFMHPIKSPESIRESYFTHGVRAFVIDTKDELYKIMRETELASDLEIFVRLALPKNKKALIDFSSKFGALPQEAAELLSLARSVSLKLGLSLHVGTQCTDPTAYGKAIKEAAKVIKQSKVTVDVLDIGGGFPVEYPGQVVPPLENFMEEIKSAIAKYKLEKMELLSEPGRILVAQSGSLIVRVEGVKGDILFLNDGTYGGLFDAGSSIQSRFPVRHIAARAHVSHDDNTPELKPYRFAGPTCDSIDMMDGPFYLSSTIKAGDWIEIGHLGSYSRSMRTNFNGFGASDHVFLLETS